MEISPALMLVRLLRRLPHTSSFDRHLTNCAALDVIYSPFGGAEPLRVAHVLKLVPLPPFVPDLPESEPTPSNVTYLH